ncbi:hypothetical protein TRAPUB_12328 [Trametes pubescens]|uniref:Uncharacterized protein n=1 Tax=Trametes pubescens TaxID=154538 RepID=A0A1M2VU74_TRAPU|nr:hypothetical protein TRAPUB_12328 [Trametes pubescens]
MLAAASVHSRQGKGKAPGGEPYGPGGAYTCLEAEGWGDRAAVEQDGRVLDAEYGVVEAAVVEMMFRVVIAGGVEMEAVAVAWLAPEPGAPYSAGDAACAAPKAPPPSEEGEVEA